MTEILTLIEAGRLQEAALALEARIAARQDEAGGHDEEARLAERLGRSAAAVRAWQLHLRDDAEDPEAWRALLVLHGERGEGEPAARCRAWLAQAGVPLEPEEPPEPPPPPGPSDADLVRFVHLFGGREDIHARMWRDPKRGVGYSPVQGPLTPELARAHLEGRITLGVYPILHDDTVRWFALDLDLQRAALDAAAGDATRVRALRATAAEEGLRLLGVLRGLGLRPLLEDSGQKGRHLWCFLPEPAPAAEVHAFGRRLVGAASSRNTMLHLEFFPKQGAVPEGGTGNLIKLPLGLHLGSGRRSILLDDAGEPLADPYASLRHVERVSLSALAPLPEAPPAPEPAPASPAVTPSTDRPWTEADFEAHPQVGALLSGCPVLAEVVRAALVDRALSRPACVVLEHTLGHLPTGVKAANYLLDRVPGVPEASRLRSPLRGNPTSCAQIRRHLPELAPRCACTFPDRPGQYAHPLRHLERLGEPAAPPPTLDELLAAYGRTLDRVQQVSREEADLRRAAVLALARVPGGRWSVPGGEWRLEGDEALPVLRFVAEGA